MDDTLDVNRHKCFNNLLEDCEDFLNSQIFIFILKVREQVTFFAELHHYLQFFLVIVIGFVDCDKIGVFKFSHDFYLFESFINFEWV